MSRTCPFSAILSVRLTPRASHAGRPASAARAFGPPPGPATTDVPQSSTIAIQAETLARPSYPPAGASTRATSRTMSLYRVLRAFCVR